MGKIRPARNAIRTGVRMSVDGSLLFTGSDEDLFEIVPRIDPDTKQPVLSLYEIEDGEKKHRLTVTTNSARSITGWLPVVINNAQRKLRQQA